MAPAQLKVAAKLACSRRASLSGLKADPDSVAGYGRSQAVAIVKSLFS